MTAAHLADARTVAADSPYRTALEHAPVIDDALWALLEPLLPTPKPRRFRYPGRKPVSDRAAMTGVLCVLANAIRWTELPVELGYGSGISCWRRLRAWQAAGVWDDVCAMLRHELPDAHQIDFSRAAPYCSPARH
jgi:transposase